MQAAPKRCSNGTVTSSVYTEDEQGRMNCSPDAHLPSLPVLRWLWCFKLVTSAAIIKYHSHFFLAKVLHSIHYPSKWVDRIRPCGFGLRCSHGTSMLRR